MYDTRGNRSKIKEGNSYWKNYTYDANNRITRTTQQADDKIGRASCRERV